MSQDSSSIGHEGSPGDGLVLIVDDNRQNAELLEAYLEEIGCRIVTASDGLDALEKVERETPDLILLDIMMPKMSGFQVCERLKESPATRDVPVIIVTALNEDNDIERANESGATDFLTKPVNRLELVTRVKSLMELGRLRRQFDKTLDKVNRQSGDTDASSEPGA